jgi:hypothetical protein
MAFARSRVKGASSLRRVLRRMPDVSRDNLADAFEAGGRRLLARAKAEAPSRSGQLRGALDLKVARKSLVMRIGLLTKRLQRNFFYGYILDIGRKAKTVTIRRGPRKGARMRIKGIARDRYDFIFGRRRDFVARELPPLRNALEASLHDVIRESGDD